jgi:adenylate cyclase
MTFIFLALILFGRIAFAETYGVVDESRESIQKFGEVKFALIMISFGSLALAFFSSLLDILVLKRIVKKWPLGIALLVGFVAQAGLIFLVISRMKTLFYTLLSNISSAPTLELAPSESLVLLVHIILAIALSKFLIEIDRKLGPGNLWKMLIGRFFKPREEERIFMFIDLKGATTTAEKIGHLEYSKLLHDCFDDFSIVDRYKAEIYQYVGDEVVVSWSLKSGFQNENFLDGFFAFSHLLKERQTYYEKTYGTFPYFKSGAHVGPVIITEVGDIKREITYHGDTLNTAARIQGMCNKLEAQLLISDLLYQKVKDSEKYIFEDVGCISLKGKEKVVNLYRVIQG